MLRFTPNRSGLAPDQLTHGDISITGDPGADRPFFFACFRSRLQLSQVTPLAETIDAELRGSRRRHERPFSVDSQHAGGRGPGRGSRSGCADVVRATRLSVWREISRFGRTGTGCLWFAVAFALGARKQRRPAPEHWAVLGDHCHGDRIDCRVARTAVRTGAFCCLCAEAEAQRDTSLGMHADGGFSASGRRCDRPDVVIAQRSRVRWCGRSTAAASAG